MNDSQFYTHTFPQATVAVLRVLPLAISTALLVNPAYAQRQLEEVVVTAQKREQSLQDVPVAVSAIDGKKFNDMGIKRLDELTVYTPGVTVTEGPSDALLFIRGIGSGLNKGFEQSVGTYVDGIYFGRGRSSRNGMVDLARAEVLKGPQGILFGKNTIAGAINLTTRNPTPEAEGYLEVSYELAETDEKVVEGAYGGYLTDNFGVRLAARYSSSDGWMENTFNGEDIGAEDDLVTRLSLLFEPSDDIEIIGKLQYSLLKQNEKNSELVTCSPAMQAIVAGIDDCRFDGKTTVSAIDPDGGYGGTEMEAMSAGLTVNWSLNDDLTLTSVTGFTKHIEDLFLDSDYSPAEILDARRDEAFESLSQEIRIASDTGGQIEYLAGAYVETNEMQFDGGLNYNSLFTRVSDVFQETDTAAIFGQVTWHLNDRFGVTVGARYSEDKKDVDSRNYCAEYKTTIATGAAACFGPAYELQADRDDENFSPAITFEWRPNGDHMLYAKYSEGYKSGGFDIQSLSGNPDTYQFDPEEAKSFEVGSKSTLLDGSMTLNLALFRNEYTNLQVSTFDGNIGFNVGNAAESVSQGLDIDLNWAFADEWTTSLSLALLDAHYESFPDAQCSYPQSLATPAGQTCVADLSDKDLQFAPEWSGHWNLTWESTLANDFLLTVAADVNFSDEFFVMADLDPNLVQDAFAKLDMRVSLQPMDGPWELALVGRNLTDEKTFHFGNDVPLFNGSYFKNYDRTRTLVVQARYHF